jgi:xanthine dehydrogenase YagS FAD-binding subunit
MCVALAALDAVVKVQGKNGVQKSIRFTDFHRLPGDSPEKDTNLMHGDLITSIDLPRSPFAARSYYLKVRDRASYAFALVSTAAALDVNSGGAISQARIALGGVAHKPWRAIEAEQSLKGKKAGSEAFARAAEIAVRDAKPFTENKFKVELAKRSIVRALTNATNGGVAGR